MPDQKPPRVVLLTRNWKFSQIALAPLLRAHPECIAGIVFSIGGLGVRRVPPMAMAQRTLTHSGLRYFLYQLADFIFPAYLATSKLLRIGAPDCEEVRDLHAVARERGYPTIDADDVNDPGVVEAISRLRPTLVLSVYFDQLIGEALIGIPPGGCLNLHPSALPKYRGVNPVFWAILHGESEIGVTFHEMNAQLDRGAIALQRFLPVGAGDSVMGLEIRAAKLAGDMLLEIVTSAAQNRPLLRVEQPRGGSYFSFPDKGQVERLRRSGRRLFRFGDVREH